MNQNRLKNRRRFHTGSVLRAVLLMIPLLLLVLQASATHFRYGNVTWSRDLANGTRAVKFSIRQAWRTSYPWGTTIAINSVITTGTFQFGDGQTANVQLKVTSINTAEDWFEGECVLSHTYSGTATDYNAIFDGCCKISSISTYQPNNHDQEYTQTTHVTLGNNNDAPVSSMPAFINMPTGSAGAHFRIPAIDPNDDSLRFYLTNITPYTTTSYNETQPPLLTIDSFGLITFPTFVPTGTFPNFTGSSSTPYTVGTLFNGSVTIRDSKGAFIQSDFLIKITGPSTPPVFDYPPTPGNNFTYNVHPGTNVSFTIQAHDNDAGDAVTLNASGLSTGAVFTPASSTATTPASATYSWTPTNAQLGAHQIVFTATDNAGVQTTTIVNIVVAVDPEFVSPTPGNGSALCVQPGQTISHAIVASNADNTRSVRFSSVSGTRTGMSFSNSIPTAYANPVSTTFSWTPTAGDWGAWPVTVTAQNATTGETKTNTITYVVNTPPTVPSTPVTSVYSNQLYTYTVAPADADAPAGDVVSLESYSVPPFLTVTDNTNGTWTISGTPTFAQAGTYTISLNFEDRLHETNGTQCGQVTQQYVLTVVPCNVTASHTTTDVSCYNGTNGAVNLTVNNATAPVSYTWTNGTTTVSTSKDLTGVGAGNYSVSVVDANGCTASDAATINQPAQLALSATIVNATCKGGSNGSIDLSVTGGTAPYTYDWGSSITTEDRSGLSAGSYNVVVTDAHNCTANAVYAITEPTAVTVTASVSDASCFGSSNGAIDITAAGGTPGYTYNWGGSITTEDRTGLAAGNYNVTVSDSKGCTGSGSFAVAQPTAVAVSSVVSDVSCNGGSNGAINITATGGTPGYSYNWGSGVTTEDRTGLSAGNYAVTVTDAHNCTGSGSFTVNQPTAVSVSGSITNVNCYGGTTGAIDITATGGTPGYSYNWGGGITTEDRSNIASGNYSVGVTDSKGCTASASFSISQPTEITIGSSVTNVTCNGQSNGAINITVNGGTPGYTYNWGGGITSEDRSGINAGSYAVTVTDSKGCSKAGSYSVSQPDPIAITGVVTNATCYGSNNGAINISVSGGTAPYSYNWGGGITSEDRTGLAAGSYSVTVLDSKNCPQGPASFTVTQPAALPAPTIAVSGADAFCNAVELTASSPTSGATYAWYYNGGTTPYATSQTIRLKVNNNDGNYSVKVTNAAGCVSNAATYSFQKQSLVNMYVLIGLREVDLAQNNDVFGGSVGVTSSYGEAEFDKYCDVASPGAFVKAHDIDVSTNVNIPNKIFSPAVVTFPTMLLNTANTSGLSDYTMTTNGTVSGNKRYLSINASKTVTVTGNIFRRIHISHDADVTFTSSDISVEEFEMDQGATVRFATNTNLRVTNEVDIDKECTINPTGKKVTFYVKDPGSSTHNHDCYSNWHNWHGNNHTDEKFIVDGRGTNIVANVYMPGGKIRVHGNGWSCSWNNNEECNMVGLFIAEEIEGDGKNINWSSYDCNMPMTFRQAAPVAIAEEAADYNVLLYPNPTSGEFTLQFAQTKEAAEVRITDVQGKTVQYRNVQPSEMPAASFKLGGISTGVYLVEVRQGANTFRSKVVLK